jgi:hypothetical protein
MVAETTFTPGPWHVGDHGTVIYDGPETSRTGGISVARAFDNASRNANARLIAAAPDYDAALVAIAGLTPFDDVTTAINIARAAIAKARSEAVSA